MNEKMKNVQEERILTPKKGMPILLINIILMLGAIAKITWASIWLYNGGNLIIAISAIVVSSIYLLVISPLLFAGLKVVRPNEALVFVLFGKYIGSVKSDGFFFVNPFATSFNPAKGTRIQTLEQTPTTSLKSTELGLDLAFTSNKISLKVLTFSNDKQKINDALGNPVIVGIVVNWKVMNTAKAVFCVDNYKEFLSIQCDIALREVAQQYPFDAHGSDCERSLRGSSQEIAEKLKSELQAKVDVAGLEIIDARIANLSYAPEIAAVMLQRQQASAVIDAKEMLVEASVGIVEMALKKLNESDMVKLDEERKAAMVSNLLVVLCGSKEAQPVVNSGSLY